MTVTNELISYTVLKLSHQLQVIKYKIKTIKRNWKSTVRIYVNNKLNENKKTQGLDIEVGQERPRTGLKISTIRLYNLDSVGTIADVGFMTMTAQYLSDIKHTSSACF